MNWVWVLTHLIAFATGAWTMRTLMLRNFRAREVDGHTVIEHVDPRSDHE